MSFLRSDIITEVRDSFYEDSASLFTDVKLRRFLAQEIRSLPRKGIYLEELHTTTTEVDRLDYPIPTGTNKIEKLERNWGTASQPDWVEIKGWDTYAGSIYLPERPTDTFTMRAHIQKGFTVLTDDVTASDIPDDKMEVVIWGVVVRAYRAIMGYLRDAKNWDAIAKPSGIQMAQINQWLRDAREIYNDLVRQYKTLPRPRDIDLVN